MLFDHLHNNYNQSLQFVDKEIFHWYTLILVKEWYPIGFFLRKVSRCSSLALIEFTFHVVIFIIYIENEVPQPQEEDAWGLNILKEDPISSFT